MPLKASPADQALLLDIQTLDTSLQQLAHRGRQLPEIVELKAIDGDTATLRVRLTTEEGAWEDTQRELARIESDVAVVETRMKRDRDRLQATSSQKDIQALEGELTALANRQSDLEDIQLDVLDRVETTGAVVAATRAELESLAERRATTDAARETALSTLADERTHAVADRATIAGKVPPELLALYERQRERYGVGASHLRAGVSSASGVALNGSDLAAVRAAAPDDVLLCPDSEAILVRTDESGL